MNRKAKNMLSVVGEHFLYIVVTLALICVVGAVFRKAYWLASVVTAAIYLSSMYSSGWNTSGKDLRRANALLKQGEADTLEYKISDGFLYALPLLILSVIVLICYLAFDGIFFVIFRVYNFSFVNLFDEFGKLHIIMDILATVLPFAMYGLGYVVGKSKKTFVIQHIGKLIYKQKKDKNQK